MLLTMCLSQVCLEMKLHFKGVLSSADSSLKIERYKEKVQSNFAREAKNNVNILLVQGKL